MLKLTVVVSYYRALDNLKIILKALNRQSCKNFEVIISEDDNNLETIDYIRESISSFNFPVIHLNLEIKDGFRKNFMLNRAISNASSQKIAFIDGDCIPHKHFVKEYIKNIDKSTFCVGRSVMLSKEVSESLIKTKSFHRINYVSLLFSKSWKLKEGIYFPFFSLSHKVRGLVGRNWGCSKKQLCAINGFDQDYVRAGAGEDGDIEWRLLRSGLKRKSVKNKVIVYHIYHDRWYSQKDVKYNYKVMKQKMEEGNIKCLNGLMSIESLKQA